MELSVQEKAERYDKAIEKAKKFYNNEECRVGMTPVDLEDIFPELKEPEDEKIRKELTDYIKKKFESSCSPTPSKNILANWITWLEKQEQSKKTSIWKHWKNGIAGNGEGKLTFLIKSGPTYSLSSCLSFECDYIELSELDNLMLEKQDNSNEEYWRGYREGKQEVLDKYAELEKQIVQNINILCWHDVSEEPEEQYEIFCECKNSALTFDNVWHDVAFYHPSNKTFWNGEQQIENVVRWTYIDDMLKEQPQSQIKPKFKAGDTIQCISDETDIRTIVEIDTLYNVYRCENNYPIPFTQENMWKLI